MPEIQKELIERRTGNSKTFDIGNGRRQLVVHIGDVHYKDNYANKFEHWKDIDLTWEGNRITKAPYELILEGQKLTLRDKKSGEVSTIELLEAKPTGLKWEILPEYTRVSFRHILPSDKVPFEAQFKITGKGYTRTRASDDEGELELETSLVDGILTEKLSQVKDKETELTRAAKGNIKIDPTWQVGESSDDCELIIQPFTWNLTYDKQPVGYSNVEYYGYGGGMRFTNIAVPQGATIDTAYLILRCVWAQAGTEVNSKISAEDVDNPPTFADDGSAFYYNRFLNHTIARVNWDNIPAWTLDEDYNSPEIKTVIKEIVDRGGWNSGNAIVIFWEDFDNRSTNTSQIWRFAYSYDNAPAYAPKLVIEYTPPPVVAPTVTTQAVDDILPTTATGNVTITDIGGENCSKRGICWSTSPNPTIANDKSEETDSFGTGAFERPMTGLLPGTHYYAKGYAYNSAGYGYGNQVEFDTPPAEKFSSDSGTGTEAILDRALVLAETGSGIESIINRAISLFDLVTKQTIISGAAGEPSTSAVEYNALMGNGNAGWVTGNGWRAGVISTPGKLSNFKVQVKTAPGSGKAWWFTIYKGTFPTLWATNLTAYIGGDNTISSLDTSEVSVNAGDIVVIHCNPAGTPDAAGAVYWTCEFTPDIAGETILLSCTNTFGLTPNYRDTLIGSKSPDSTEFDAHVIFPTSGTLKKFYVQAYTAAPGNGNSRIFTIVKNGIAQSLVVTISGTDFEGSDTDPAHNVSIAAGDKVTIRYTQTGTPPASLGWFGITFLPDVPGEYIAPATTDDLTHSTNTEYQHLSCGDSTLGVDETEFHCLAQKTTVKAIYVNLLTAPGAGKSYAFTLRRNAAISTASTKTISNEETSGNDAADVAISADDLLDTMIVPSGTPATTKSQIAYLLYNVPQVLIPSDTGSGVDAKLAGNPVATISKADSGSGTEGTPIQAATLAKSDVGSGQDIVAQVEAILQGTDGGTGLEALLDRAFASIESGTGIDIGILTILIRSGSSIPRSKPDFYRRNIQIAERHNIQDSRR